MNLTVAILNLTFFRQSACIASESFQLVIELSRDERLEPNFGSIFDHRFIMSGQTEINHIPSKWPRVDRPVSWVLPQKWEADFL